ncbi:MAG: helix-turn-helix domain-containing protein [Bacteroidia bacterium]
MEPSVVVGANIKKVREEKGIKQEVLAKHLGISKSRMSQIEGGDCEELSIKKINRIAEYLKVDFFSIAGNNPQNVHINNSTNCSGFNGTHYNISPDLIKALADELVTRMSKTSR